MDENKDCKKCTWDTVQKNMHKCVRCKHNTEVLDKDNFQAKDLAPLDKELLTISKYKHDRLVAMFEGNLFYAKPKTELEALEHHLALWHPSRGTLAGHLNLRHDVKFGLCAFYARTCIKRGRRCPLRYENTNGVGYGCGEQPHPILLAEQTDDTERLSKAYQFVLNAYLKHINELGMVIKKD